MKPFITAILNYQPVQVTEGMTIMELASMMHISIPSLHPDITITSPSDICFVEITGVGTLCNAKKTIVVNGMVILTHSIRVRRFIRNRLLRLAEYHLSHHEENCLLCHYLERYHIDSNPKKIVEVVDWPYQMCYSSNQCMQCGSCIMHCEAMTDALTASKLPPFIQMDETKCIGCGVCLQHCLVNAIQIPSSLDSLIKYLIAQQEPYLAVIEDCGKYQYEEVRNKLIQFGMSAVIDSNIAKKIRYIEMANELVERLTAKADSGKTVPFIIFDQYQVKQAIVKNNPDFKPYLSKVKSTDVIMQHLLKRIKPQSVQHHPQKLHVVFVKSAVMPLEQNISHYQTTIDVNELMAQSFTIAPSKAFHVYQDYEKGLYEYPVHHQEELDLQCVLEIFCSLMNLPMPNFHDIWDEKEQEYSISKGKFAFKIKWVKRIPELMQMKNILHQYDLIMVSDTKPSDEFTKKIIEDMNINRLYKKLIKAPGFEKAFYE